MSPVARPTRSGGTTGWSANSAARASANRQAPAGSGNHQHHLVADQLHDATAVVGDDVDDLASNVPMVATRSRVGSELVMAYPTMSAKPDDESGGG